MKRLIATGALMLAAATAFAQTMSFQGEPVTCDEFADIGERTMRMRQDGEAMPTLINCHPTNEWSTLLIYLATFAYRQPILRYESAKQEFVERWREALYASCIHKAIELSDQRKSR